MFSFIIEIRHNYITLEYDNIEWSALKKNISKTNKTKNIY